MKLLTKIRKEFSIKLTLYLFLGIMFGSVLNWIWFNRTVSRNVRVSSPFCEAADKISLVSASDEITESRQNAIVRAAQKVGPAVVSISVVQTRTVREEPFFSPSGDEFFDEFWGRFFPPREYKEKINSLGSGVIINPEGYILTNEHVVRGAEELKVTLPSGKEYKGKLVGQDVTSDLAVIGIDDRNLPYAALGNSDDLIIGEWAIALGNPFGYLLDDPNPTVTVGVVSAVNRDLKRGQAEERIYSKMIQTDAAINPGNSGGPLVNALGEVIGINTFIFTTSRGSEGIGFAIPINRAKKIIADLMKFGKVTKVWTGIKVQDLNSLLAQSLDLDQERGVVITEVFEKSPGEKADLKRGDVILKINHQDVKNAVDWEDLTSFIKAGENLGISFVRKGEKKETTLVPEELSPKMAAEYESDLGISVSSITPQIAYQLKTKDRKGVIVTSVKPESKADKLGLKEGDIIRQINNTPVENLKDYQRLTKDLKKNEKIVLFVEREGEIYFLTLIY